MIDKMKTKRIMFAMGCITILESIALFQGMNGLMLTSVIGIIAGLGGYSIARIQNNK